MGEAARKQRQRDLEEKLIEEEVVRRCEAELQRRFEQRAASESFKKQIELRMQDGARLEQQMLEEVEQLKQAFLEEMRRREEEKSEEDKQLEEKRKAEAELEAE